MGVFWTALSAPAIWLVAICTALTFHGSYCVSFYPVSLRLTRRFRLQLYWFRVEERSTSNLQRQIDNLTRDLASKASQIDARLADNKSDFDKLADKHNVLTENYSHLKQQISENEHLLRAQASDLRNQADRLNKFVDFKTALEEHIRFESLDRRVADYDSRLIGLADCITDVTKIKRQIADHALKFTGIADNLSQSVAADSRIPGAASRVWFRGKKSRSAETVAGAWDS